jgi:maleylacetoacetate isomerase
MLKLYSYYRSSAAFRVRIALNLKQVQYEIIPIHLLREGGQQHSLTYRQLNPQGLIPALEEDGNVITQSLAIIEYLEEKFPNPTLLPHDLLTRAQARAVAQSIACDIHPLNNLRVTNYLTQQFLVDEPQKMGWYQHWIELGLRALEQQLAHAPTTGKYCFGDSPTIADICLVPQLLNARRFHCSLADYPTLVAIEEQCLILPAFTAALPANQPDAEQ